MHSVLVDHKSNHDNVIWLRLLTNSGSELPGVVHVCGINISGILLSTLNDQEKSA